MFHESLAELQQEFDSLQVPGTAKTLLGPHSGFHVLNGPGVRGPDDSFRKEYKRLHELKRDYARIREALARGERPNTTRRPPTRWLTIAKEMGVAL